MWNQRQKRVDGKKEKKRENKRKNEKRKKKKRSVCVCKLLYPKENKKKTRKTYQKLNEKGSKIGEIFLDFLMFSYDWVKLFVILFLSVLTLHYMLAPLQPSMSHLFGVFGFIWVELIDLQKSNLFIRYMTDFKVKSDVHNKYIMQ